MTNPRDDDATLARVYAALEDTVHAGEDDDRRPTVQAQLALVAAYHQKPGKLLDVGCATGMFACAAHEAGWEATGLEPSAWAVERAQRRCPGATFVCGLLEEAAFPSESFSVITLWDVMEHVRSPAETLHCIHKWLTPGGWLFLNSPNADSLIARLMGRHWVLLLREHLWYFSPLTMSRLLRQSGLEMIRTRPNFVRFSIANVAGRLAQYPDPLGGFARRMESIKLLKQWAIRFPMGEMNVVARKIRE